MITRKKFFITFNIFFVFSIHCQNQITFTYEEFQKINYFIKKNKEILYFCDDCPTQEIKRIRIYTFRTFFNSKKEVTIKINEKEIFPQNIYVFYVDQYKNLVALVKKDAILFDRPIFLQENQIPPNVFKIKTQNASDIPFLTQFEKELIDAINLLRSEPHIYRDKLEKKLHFYRGNQFVIPGEIVINTKEGTKAVIEAIDVLKQTPPLPQLDIQKELCDSSKFHVNDTGPKGIVSHFSSNGLSPVKRILSFGNFKSVGEVISYGFYDPEEIVLQFLIDDGVYDRGHRNALLNRNFRYIGASCGSHKTYHFMCVVNFGE